METMTSDIANEYETTANMTDGDGLVRNVHQLAGTLETTDNHQGA